MRVLKIALGALVGLVVLWNVFYPAVRVNYRLTLEVETPEGPRTGGGVIAMYYGLVPQLWATQGVDSGVQGEAVAVDLGPRGTMFALLTGRTRDGTPGWPEAHHMLTKVMAPELWAPGKMPDRERVSRVGQMSGTREVPAEFIPFLVRFRDEKDPKSVEAVDPANLAASFGPGVMLSGVTIEMVSAGTWPLSLFGIGGEPVTRGIEGRLGWLDHLDQYRSDPNNRFTSTLPREIAYLRKGKY